MADRIETAESALLRPQESRPRELRNKQMSPKPKRDPLACATGGGSFRKAGGFSYGTPTTNSASIHTHQPSYESLRFLPHSGEDASIMQWCYSLQRPRTSIAGSSTTPAYQRLQHPSDASAAGSSTAPAQAQQQQLEDDGAAKADPRPSDMGPAFPVQGERPSASGCLPHAQYSRGGGILSMGVESNAGADGHGTESSGSGEFPREVDEVPRRGLLTRGVKMLKSLVYYLVCGPSADHQHEPDATLMYPYDGYDIEAAQHVMQNQAVPPVAELRRRNLNPFSVNSVVAQTQEKQRRQAVNDWIKQVGDALAVPQSLTRLAYFAEITLWTTLLLHRPLCPTSLAPTRDVVAIVIEMILGFLAVSYTHCCIVSHHSVTTTALHISKKSERAMANMFAILTCGWMICYTLNISSSLYHHWIWAITVPFVLININNTYIYGYKGLMIEARVLHI